MKKSHILQRAFERFPGVCAPSLIRQVIYGVRCEDPSLAEYVGCLGNNTFKTLYLFKTASGQTGYAVVSEPTKYVITLLNAGCNKYVSGQWFFLGHDGLEAIFDG